MAENNLITANDQDRLKAKSALRKYYIWRFGELPPQGWQADHQVEQNVRFAEIFGFDYVHNIANLIFVPADINADKNKRYQRTWASVPKKYRQYNPLTYHLNLDGSEPFEQGAQSWVRDGLFALIRGMSDVQAFCFLYEFSRDMLKDIIRFKEKGIWRTKTPQWLENQPQWLDRLKDEVHYHTRYVSEYIRKFPTPRSNTPPRGAPDLTANDLERLVGLSHPGMTHIVEELRF